MPCAAIRERGVEGRIMNDEERGLRRGGRCPSSRDDGSPYLSPNAYRALFPDRLPLPWEDWHLPSMRRFVKKIKNSFLLLQGRGLGWLRGNDEILLPYALYMRAFPAPGARGIPCWSLSTERGPGCCNLRNALLNGAAEDQQSSRKIEMVVSS